MVFLRLPFINIAKKVPEKIKGSGFVFDFGKDSDPVLEFHPALQGCIEQTISE